MTQGRATNPDDLRMRAKRRGVERIVVLREGDGEGQRRAQVLVKTRGKGGRSRRRGSRRRDTEGLGWLEAFTHDTARAASTGVNTYLERHERSNRRKRDGWLRDLPDNAWTAWSRSKRELRWWRYW